MKKRYSAKPYIEIDAETEEISIVVYLNGDKRIRFPLKNGTIEKRSEMWQDEWMVDNLDTMEWMAKSRGLIK